MSLLMIISSFFRVILFLSNFNLASHSDLDDILYAFFNRGILSDINILSYIFLLPFILVSIPLLTGRKGSVFVRISNILIILAAVALIIISAIDLGYFKYYNSRITSAVFTLIDDIGITLSVVFTETDNLILAFSALLLTGIFIWLQLRISRKVFDRPPQPLHMNHRILVFAAGFLLMIFGLRGTYSFKDTPLIYRNFFFTDDHFMNQLGFNPVYHLGYSFGDPQINYFESEDEFIDTALHYLDRIDSGQENPFTLKVEGNDSLKPNIILVFLESMSNAMVSRYNPRLNTTPFLDSLATQGIVFDRFYAAGIHTHNAIFTTMYGLPAVMNNVPMNSLATENQVFHGLPFILKEKNYLTSFYVTGSKEFDNMNRFLSVNGFDRIIGNEDYPPGAIYNHWGATDETMFHKVVKDCDSLSRSGQPFFSCILTITSHDGYLVPEGFENRLKNQDYPEKLYEYADLQLKQFMLSAAGTSWFSNTVFVFVGDHGQNFSPLYDMNLNYHLVPLILYAPGLIEPGVYKEPGLQQDIYPTLCGLLGMSYVNNGLGVDLFRHRREYGYFSADNKLGVIDDSLYLIYRGKGNISLYEYCNNSTDDIHIDHEPEVNSMLNYGFSMLQSASYLIENKLNGFEMTQEERYHADRFIAHAGGMIDGHIYTNSLEALNNSYRDGFRLFELDINHTSDNVLVAVHDWKEWKEMTGFDGGLPPSHKEFINHKLHGTYSPLDMDAINSWFGSHPDAILVTDKINEPVEFSTLFTDKQQLMMELFTLSAVKEGLSCGILSAMPNWSVLNEIPGDKVQFLKQMGITDIAASRRIIGDNLPLLLRLKHNGIKVFVYHVNYDKGKDEAFVIANEMDYIYGMYADKLIFPD